MDSRRRRLPGRRGISFGLTLFVCVLAGTGAARASFSWPTGATAAVSTATLAPVSGFSATGACNGLLSAKATLTGTATTSAFAAGYKLQRFKNGNPDGSLTTLNPVSTATVTETSLATGTSYSWNLYAYYQGWTSPVASTSATTPAVCL